jgi:hypothetical protein
MTQRGIAAFLLAAVCALAAGVVVRPPAAQAQTLDQQMKASIVALQCAIERDGSGRLFAYPHASAVRAGTGLRTAWWPRDPWTGGLLSPGSGRGHYSYWRAKDYRSYRLVGHLSAGIDFVVTGSMPHTARLAYDHRGQEGLNLIRQYVEKWARAHSGRLPAAAAVGRDGAVGRQDGGLFWPSNPWDHGPMAQRDDRGSFAYALAEDGHSYVLRLHRALKDDYVLRGNGTDQPLAADSGDPRVRQARQNLHLLQGYIELHAALNGFVYPDASQVQRGTSLVAPIWPLNPWNGKPMAPGKRRGTYTYSPAPDRSAYKLVGHLPAGAYTLSGGSPAWLADERAQAGAERTIARNEAAKIVVQVLKEYVDEWKATHDGVPPSAGELRADGAVGGAHAYWPDDPWTGGPVAPGGAPGQFVYVPGADGAYDLAIRLEAGGMYPELWPAQ